MKMLVKAALVLAAAAALASCKTPNASGLKEDEVRDGLDPSAGDPAKVATWQYQLGLDLADGDGGASVARLAVAEYAHVVGVKKGDLIVSLSGKPVASAQAFEDAAAALAGNGPDGAKWDGVWTIGVKRDGQEVVLKPARACNPYVPAGCGPFPGSN